MMLHLVYWSLLLLTAQCNVIQEGVAYQGTIKPYETQRIQFSGNAGLKRVFYFQCTGSADLSIMEIHSDSSNKELKFFKDFVAKGSGECEESYECHKAPCDISTCPSASDAECINNYCDGCIAEYRVGGDVVDCNEPGSSGNIVYTKGAPPHKAVLQFKDASYTFSLLGKRSSIDSTNTFQLYVFDNFNVEDTLIMLGEEAEVSVAVENSTVQLHWTEPVYGMSEDVLQHYCIYYLEMPYGKQLDGDWVACGHEIKKTESPISCSNETFVHIKDLQGNRSHYIWVVAVSNQGNTTAYPFVRVDMEEGTLNKTLLLTYSLFLLLLAVFLIE